ncbi:NifU family protein [Amycolatopsis saalfeldensis]|uniref:Fe-S cluster biogenesis protein NfuA, 4Fe-4S-binding domain n=1 Tax=Amycolatopsis saalfeldensis TaxID=394193 RepID=A0A1H8YCI5_9PSEU|nr:NifU family protein [Amycolatopsis saalfeldensis]SEP49855.1 Fe-S cluster biogenesis protein NfuA, 4Fe-4S-binding domain [Amycolatopsis saalfeldensis]
MTDVGQVGERIDRLLGELSGEDAEVAEDLVHTLLEFYGEGLARIVDAAGPQLVAKFAEDEHIAGLLVLHDLHPKTTLERVTEALDKVRPYLGSHAGDVDIVGITGEGVLQLQLMGTCDGCPSSTVTAKYAIERVVREAAPEISDVVVEGVVPEPTGPGGRPLLPLEALECPVPVEQA